MNQTPASVPYTAKPGEIAILDFTVTALPSQPSEDVLYLRPMMLGPSAKWQLAGSHRQAESMSDGTANVSLHAVIEMEPGYGYRFAMGLGNNGAGSENPPLASSVGYCDGTVTLVKTDD